MLSGWGKGGDAHAVEYDAALPGHAQVFVGVFVVEKLVSEVLQGLLHLFV